MRRALSLLIFGILIAAGTTAAIWYVQSRPRSADISAVGMDPYEKDRIDAFAKLLGISTVLIAAIGAWTSAKTRKRELRRQLVRDAHEAIVEIHKDPQASEAVRMMESFIANRAYSAKDASTGAVELSEKRAWAALEAEGGGEKGAEHVYDCVDWFLYYVDRIARLSRRELIDPSEVGSALRPFAVLIMAHRGPFDLLASKRGYDDVMEYLAGLAKRDSRRNRRAPRPGRGSGVQVVPSRRRQSRTAN